MDDQVVEYWTAIPKVLGSSPAGLISFYHSHEILDTFRIVNRVPKLNSVT